MHSIRKSRFARLSRLIACAAIALPASVPARDAIEPAEDFEPLSLPQGVDACRRVENPDRRLACYDALPGAAVSRSAEERARLEEDEERRLTETAEQGLESLPNADADQTPLTRSAMTREWELDDATDGGLLHLRRHRPVYLLPVRWSNRPNRAPFVDLPGAVAPAPRSINEAEVKFQFSLKTKFADNLIGDNVDLWAAYTQQSNWQAYNSVESEPFRETNYSPEVFASIRTGVDLLGWRWRMVNLGFMHQSNGRADPLSRSWNRAYATFGFERGRYRLLVRPWWTVQGSDDDNPDIDDYLGWGDIRLDWSRGRHDFGLMGRWAPGERRGAFQFDWHYPLYGDLKAYLQVFSGYGETLIDYNHRQTTVGIGISLVQ